MRKILIVDDEREICETVKEFLDATGRFETHACSESIRAFTMAKALCPDVIFLDVVMPGMSGPEVAEKLRTDPVTRNIPLVFLTVIVSKQEVLEKKGVIGGVHIVAKPASVEELLKVINQVTDEKETSKG